jgi:hypothetical protein
MPVRESTDQKAGHRARTARHVRRGLERGLGAGEFPARSVRSVRSRAASVQFMRLSHRSVLMVKRSQIGSESQLRPLHAQFIRPCRGGACSGRK